jgi:type II secretory ATPase GspE/PulE/Tfp pilus assembly ATPase PilB-like protein
VVTDIDVARVSDDFARLVLPEFARDRLVISQGVDAEGRERLIMPEGPAGAAVAHNIAVRLNRACVTEHGDPEVVAAALDELHAERPVGDSTTDATGGLAELEDLAEVDERDVRALLEASERDLLSTSGRAPVVKLVNGLLFEALRRRASDIHVQSRGDQMVVRFRIDGVLLDARSLPRKLLGPVVSRVKVMAKMDIAERRLPQDGRASVTIGDKEIDLRVSSLPTAGGERLVIRLLDKRQTGFFELANLGLDDLEAGRLREVCSRSHGMLLVTGPTGSGKTTTLYSVLREVGKPELNIMTLEDPIEYELPGVSQSQINTKKGVTFATGLRHVLRQDPDIIMVGEVRDGETGRVAVQSALTGHLVLSTLHTNSAAGAITRLADLGVEPYLINASLSAVMAQRLVRRLCDACAGSGCESCLQLGFRGRVGLFELMVINDEIRELITRGVGVPELTAAGRRAGMRTLRESGDLRMQQGVTTLAEVKRVTLVEEAVA